MNANCCMKNVIVIALMLVVVCCLTSTPASADFQAGAAMRVITPDPLLPVSGGVGKPTPTMEALGDLTVRALVLARGETRVALVSVDNLGWPAVWGDKTRALVPGIPPENILIGATHTHSAPDAYCFPIDGKGNHGADLDYLNWVCERMADAINEAVETLRPAALRIAVGEAKGKIAYNYYAPQLYDPRCSVLQAVSVENGNASGVIATLVNYAIHPEVLGSGLGILSPDLCGPLYDRIEAEAGGMALFFNGAQGGMITADNRRPDDRDLQTWDECIRIGELLADETLRIIADAPLQETPALHCVAREITLPVASPLMKMILAKSPMAGQMQGEEGLKTTLNVVTVGTAQMLTIPGEALPNIGYYLKRNMPTEHHFLLGLTNDAYGYILVKYDFDSFKRYDYISRTSLGEMTGEIYIEEALRLVAEAPKPDSAP